MSDDNLITAEAVRSLSAMLDRLARLKQAVSDLSKGGVGGVYFERPATCPSPTDPPVSNAWGEITGDRVPDLLKVFKAERDALEKELKRLGVKP